jgi:Ca2+-binding RTX toxin-like protein
MTTLEPLESRRLLTIDVYPVTLEIAEGSTFIAGETIDVRVVVANAGNGATVLPVTGRVVLSVDRTFGNADDIVFGSFETPSLAAGGSREVSVARTLASNVPTGAYYVGVNVDVFNYFSETNETNNVGVSNARLVAVVPTIPTTPIQLGDGDDNVTITRDGTFVVLTVNGAVWKQQASLLSRLQLFGNGGNDKIVADALLATPLAISGGGGNDTIIGGAGNDELSGANGSDRVFGGRGDDHLIGGANNDRLYGDEGSDTLSGGGGTDFLYGSAGANWLMGGNGNDKLFARGNGGIDTVSGNAGNDYAESDPGDLLASIETLG